MLIAVASQWGRDPAASPAPVQAGLAAPDAFSARVFAKAGGEARAPVVAGQVGTGAGPGGQATNAAPQSEPPSIWSAPAKFAPPGT